GLSIVSGAAFSWTGRNPWRLRKRPPLRFRQMSELPPEIAVEHEPTDSDPPPEAIRPDRPRIWPEEPRAPRPQIKRPMEEWLAEFEERGRDRRPNPPRGDAPPPPSSSDPQSDPNRRRRRRGRGRGRGPRPGGPSPGGGPSGPPGPS